MTRNDFKSLLQQTLMAPHDAARVLIAMQLSRQWLWMALALMTVLNGIVYSLSVRLSPPQTPEAVAMVPPAFQSPFLFTMFLFGALVITVFVLHWIGQSLGGTAALRDILVALTWLQVLRLILQLVLLVTILISPLLGLLVVFLGSLWGLYILVAFVDTAHGFDSMIKALGVIVLAVVAIVFGASLILTVTLLAFFGVA